jgi:NADH:ubiquinone reductase (H+-translocating)
MGLGMVCGLFSSVLLVLTLPQSLVGIALGSLIGLVYGFGVSGAAQGTGDRILTAAAFGVPLWAIWSVTLLPLLAGQSPQWTPTGLGALFPALVGWVAFGALLAALFRLGTSLIEPDTGPRPLPMPPSRENARRIVILGGDFAGVSTAEHLEQLFGPDPTVTLTLVSDTNALLFTPMLAEVAASSLEATHISHPLRTALRRTTVVRGEVAQIDLARRVVLVAGDERASAQEIAFDHLVLALGAVSNFLGLTNVQQLAFDFKTLTDAIRIRNHVIDMFEQADREPDPTVRRTLLTFVIAGGGFAGAELAGGLNDFARGMLAYYPHIMPEELQIVLVHSRERILPELSLPLAEYARERMAARGVTFKLNTRVADARPGVVILKPAEELPTATLVWTVGTTPNPVVQALPLERNQRGAVLVDVTLAVPGHAGLWALGDCAAVPDMLTSEMCPPTAQYALREAKTLAHNIHASIHGRPLKPFRFASLGALCVVGHHTACAELSVPFTGGRTVRFSGLFAWLLWRGIYLSKLPGLERQVRVLSDWLIELFFPRDIVQTIDLRLPKQRSSTD